MFHTLAAYGRRRSCHMELSDSSKVRAGPYTATCVVYCALDWILKEFLPGPEGLSTVVLSARNVT